MEVMMTTPRAPRDVARVDTPGIRGGYSDALRVRPRVELLRRRLGHLGEWRRRTLIALLQVAREQVG
jgi:hypothetical protein